MNSTPTLINLDQYQRIFLVGIKGVGMTALALALSDLGKTVTGSDSTESQITDSVLSDRNLTPKPFSADNITPDIDLVVYSGAYQRSLHPELQQASALNLPVTTQAHAVAALTRLKQTIAVCGVGGKTTTTAMLTHILHTSQTKPSWLIGVSRICDHLPPGKFDTGSYLVLEADEYAISPPENNQPKFSLYHPQTIICTNLTYDHPDIYPDFGATQAAFLNFFTRLKPDHHLIINADDPHLIALAKKLPHPPQIHSFGQSPKATSPFTFDAPSNTLHLDTGITIKLSVLGAHNAANAAAAAIAAQTLHIPDADIKTALESFTGVKRRLETIVVRDQVIYLDDYAHHPLEITRTLTSLKTAYPTKRLIAVFQPHTYSRTKALLTDFAQAFSSADLLILAPIFASARELADQSISSSVLLSHTKPHHPNVLLLDSFTQIARHLSQIRRPGDIIITLGAGDIYKLHQTL